MCGPCQVGLKMAARHRPSARFMGLMPGWAWQSSGVAANQHLLASLGRSKMYGERGASAPSSAEVKCHSQSWVRKLQGIRHTGGSSALHRAIVRQSLGKNLLVLAVKKQIVC